MDSAKFLEARDSRKGVESEDMEISTSVKRKYQDSTDTETNFDEYDIKRKIRKVSEESSTYTVNNRNVSTSEQEVNSKVPASCQEILTTEQEENSTVPASCQEILTTEHAENYTVPASCQEILTTEPEEHSPIPASCQELLTKEQEENSTVPASNKKISTTEPEESSSFAEITQELSTKEWLDNKNQLDFHDIDEKSVSEIDLLQSFLAEVERTWKVVNRLTGFKFGIIPPMCLSQGQEVGHWIKLSRKVIPFVYVTPTGGSIPGVNDVQDSIYDVKTKSSAAALLITEYVNSVINNLELQADDELVTFKVMLKELHALLKDIDSSMFSKTRHNSSLTMSKVKELKIKVDQMSLIDKIDRCTSTERILTLTESHLLCRILGLSDKFVQKMIDIKDERALRKSPICILETFFEAEMNEVNMNRRCNEGGNITSDLLQMGLSQEKTQGIVNKIIAQNEETQSAIYWVKEYLDSLFTTHQLLTPLPLLDRYADELINEWFDAEVYLRATHDGNSIKLNFQMIKVDFRSDELKSAEIFDMFRQPGCKLLFHGTRKTDSLDSILREGIMLDRGRSRQDFSDGSGFYLSDDIEAAENWVKNRGRCNCAVIIYRIPLDLLEFGVTGGLNLSRNANEWSSVVKYHRSGSYLEQEVPNTFDLENRPFIKGPVCVNGKKIRRNVSPIMLKINGRRLQQYCIRDEMLALDISPLVVGVALDCKAKN
ncbi:unnamed protein product [Lymnaea stagnalis]|uniref:PARP catalytic domain-containing protein n=1 Tax=Lymnaea stagnalis TaxID=6523 RepID=A0AAV2HQQ7_LYMST